MRADSLVVLLIFLLVLSSSGWTAAQSVPGNAPVTVIVVRHAEKEIDDSRDPVLSEVGLERAQALAGVMEHAGLDAVYASRYRRTQSTAMPAAKKAGVPVIVDPIEGDIDAWAQGFAARLAQNHAGETVLVAGHSNTVPPLVAALCRCQVKPLSEDDYDRLFIVNRAGGDDPTLIAAHYGTK